MNTTRTRAEQLEQLALLEACGFAELLGTMYSLRFTGPVTLHFLNGQPQAAEVGRPVRVDFPEHPANRGTTRGGASPRVHNSLDNRAPVPTSSST